jgi:hypothetical protein
MSKLRWTNPTPDFAAIAEKIEAPRLANRVDNLVRADDNRARRRT